jgi:hypothetical protein
MRDTETACLRLQTDFTVGTTEEMDSFLVLIALENGGCVLSDGGSVILCGGGWEALDLMNQEVCEILWGWVAIFFGGGLVYHVSSLE